MPRHFVLVRASLPPPPKSLKDSKLVLCLAIWKTPCSMQVVNLLFFLQDYVVDLTNLNLMRIPLRSTIQSFTTHTEKLYFTFSRSPAVPSTGSVFLAGRKYHNNYATTEWASQWSHDRKLVLLTILYKRSVYLILNLKPPQSYDPAALR